MSEPEEAARTDEPLDFAASQVDALFSDARSYCIGSFGVFTAISVTAWRTHSPLLWTLAAIFGALAGARLRLMHRYRQWRARAYDSRHLRHWQFGYHAGAAVHMGLISLYGLATFLITTAATDRLMAAATVITYMTGIPGRNFASKEGVDVQILCGAVPLTAALISAGGDYWMLILVVLVPFFVALRGLSARLRGIFVEATTRAYDLSLLTHQLDAAVNNMSHGLAMFDRHGRLVMHNERLCALLRLPPSDALNGRHFQDLFSGLNYVTEAHSGDMRDPVRHLPSEPVGLQLSDGLALELTFQGMRSGGFVLLVQDVTERKRAERLIYELAHFDELTGVANRAYLRSLLQDVLARRGRGARFALMFIDLDQFKQVNDTLGHACGDLLLKEVAHRIKLAMPDEAFLARFGGDEFLMFAPVAADEDGLADAHKLLDAISQPFDAAGHEILVGASIGISLYPQHGSEFDELLKAADTALYRAKAQGRGACCLFEESMDDESVRRRQLEHDLSRALKYGEFELFFQPVFSVRERRYTSCEALIRWNHPTRGRVSPGEFIPVAEEMGLIVDIGSWVLAEACRQCASWPTPMAVAVNISALQFRRPDLTDTVKAALAAANLAPNRLILELTESVLLHDIAHTNLTMSLLAAHRVKLALDDFGTGYSSLSYLQKLPFDKVKVDRSFVVDLESNRRTVTMFKSLARLIQDLGLGLVVEGVETLEQWQLISSSPNVDEVQGYLFSRPLPDIELRQLLSTQTPPKELAFLAQVA